MTRASQTPADRDDRERKLSRSCLAAAVAMALVWALAVSIFGYEYWPHMPMDIASTDPATVAIYENVVRRFVLSVAGVALTPLALVIIFAGWICRRPSSKH